jgi:hypothetical protein
MSGSQDPYDEKGVEVVIRGVRYVATTESPVIFGRSDALDIIGLDPTDMGISAKAGAVEYGWGVWWVVNHSGKRRLLVEESTAATADIPVECGDRYALTSRRVVVRVAGAILTHRIEVLLPESAVAALHITDPATSGTLTFERAPLSEKDLTVLTAIFEGYLLPFPRRDGRPRTYQEAAESLGPPWTRVTVRKQIERIKERLRRQSLYFEGPRANDDLAAHLLANGILSPSDLSRLERGGRSR